MRTINLKFGLFIEKNGANTLKRTETATKEFWDALKLVRESDLDLWVLPEGSFLPAKYSKTINKESVALKISEDINKAVIVGFCTENNGIFDVYANASATKSETKVAVYYKHIFNDESPLEQEDYSQDIESHFPIIILKGYSIGITICYDLTQPIDTSWWYTKPIREGYRTGKRTLYTKENN